MENSSSLVPGLDFKTRRPHTKSRNGCVECKRQRRKCDELMPRCTRCARQNRDCYYSKASSRIRPLRLDERKGSSRLSPPRQDAWWDVQILTPHSPSSSTASSRAPSSYANHSALGTPSLFENSPAGNPSPAPSFSDGIETRFCLQSIHTLDSTELELFSHYLVHTSRIIPFDRGDLYALHVGIPSLAFRSKPLMSSIFALAAACKCNDLLATASSCSSTSDSSTRNRIRDLLLIADRHHRESLRQIQDVMLSPECYDHVLTNAALMVLYGSASHWVRIQLVQTATEDEVIPSELLPSQPQWMSLIRAAHLAYMSLENNQLEMDTAVEHPTEMPMTDFSVLGFDWAAPVEEEVAFPEDGPSNRTRELLFPILATTCIPALKELRRNAYSIARQGFGHESSDGDSTSPMTNMNPISELDACLSALEELHRTVAEVFSISDAAMPMTADPDPPNPPAFQHASRSSTVLSRVSPWVRNYLGRVTSAVKVQRPLRRTIMSFLNQVSCEYFELVHSSLELAIDMSNGADSMTDDSANLAGSGVEGRSQQPTPAQQLALDIFAHWLVLVMLLDGVWWIGGIGRWELARVVSAMRDPRWSQRSVDIGGEWWPESMYNAGLEIQKR